MPRPTSRSSGRARPCCPRWSSPPRVRRARLGIAGAATPIGSGLARSLGLSANSGIRVLDVTDRSPAARAGIRKDDILVSFDGATIASLTDLQRALVAERIGHATLV